MMISSPIRILAIAVSLAYLIGVVASLRQSRMNVRQSLLWLCSGAAFICLSVFPGPLIAAAKWLGFIAPSNAAFTGWLLILTMLLFYQSLVTSRQSEQIKRLCQELAISRAHPTLLISQETDLHKAKGNHVGDYTADEDQRPTYQAQGVLK